jgi:hypothetical protein
MGRDVPYVSRRIHDSPHPVTPRLVRRGQQDDRPCSNGSTDYRVSVIDVDINNDRRASISFRGTTVEMRILSMNHKQGIAYLQRGMYDLAILCGSARKLLGVKCVSAELNLRGDIRTNQHRYKQSGTHGVSSYASAEFANDSTRAAPQHAMALDPPRIGTSIGPRGHRSWSTARLAHSASRQATDAMRYHAR